MHQIEHLAEDSDREPHEIAEAMRKNGTYALLEEEIARAKALDFLAENAVPAPMPEEEDLPDAEKAGSGEASVEAKIEAGAKENEESEEK